MRSRCRITLLVPLTSIACLSVSRDDTQSLFADLPLDSIVRTSLSGATAGGSWGGGASVSPSAGVRHAQYEGVFDLLPEARAGFQRRLCREIESDLRRRGNVQGTGNSGNICSVHITDGDRHGWIDTVVWMDEQSGRARVAVLLSDW